MFRLSVFLVLLLGSPAYADLFSAAGRLENAFGRGTCSAALIEPDVIITAAHCVTEAEGYHFRVATTDEFEPIAVSQVVIHPLYTAFRGNRFRRLSFDIAIAKLSEPVDASVATPFTIGGEASDGEGLFVSSWTAWRERPRERRCVVIEGQVPAVVTLGCNVFGGESGAPLMRLTDDGVELVAVVNSRLEQGDRSFALATDARLRVKQLLDLLAGDP